MGKLKGVGFCDLRWSCGVVLWMCSLAIRSLVAETIHFTNSPKLIMASKNFTTYEIEVPGSKPITIIEATDPYDRSPLPTFPKEVQIPAGGPTTSFRTSTGLSVGRPAPDSSSSEQMGGTRKTLYSPELLNKFLKEYSEKLRNADSATRKRLNEITMINNSINRNQNEAVAPERGDGTDVPNQYRNKVPPPHRDVDIEAEEEEEKEQGAGEPVPGDEPKTEDEFVFNDTHERHGGGGFKSNKRWYQETAASGVYHAQPQQTGHKNHPWNIKDGWVTLEAVPWSESKVSKWHTTTGSVSELNANQPGKAGGATSAPMQQYWNAAGIASEEMPKYKPIATSGSIGASSYYSPEDDAYGYGGGSSLNRLPASAQPPVESFYNRRRPTATLYSERPDASGDRGRPSPQQAPTRQQQPLDSWYEQQQLHTSNPYDSMKAHHDQERLPTAHRDIITDGRPANFPKFTPARPAAAPSPNGYGDDEDDSAATENKRIRPVSYPDRGNGEWVLISTTKGYQYPKRRHGQRAITFAPATSTSHQTVKLTVLPMKNAIDMTTSHNGLIEVSSSTQTVEDAVKQQKSKRKGGQVGGLGGTEQTRPVGQRKKKHPKAGTGSQAQAFSLMRRDAAQDSSAVLAAVGAGMVPATMAILAPMVLGRKKK